MALSTSPCQVSTRCEHTVLGELLRDAVVGHPLKEKLVDAPDGHGLLRVDDQIAVSAFVITEEPLTSLFEISDLF